MTSRRDDFGTPWTLARVARALLVSALLWLSTAALLSQVVAMNYRARGLEGSWWGVFEWTLPVVAYWTVMTPVLLAFTRRFRWDRMPAAAFLALHAVTSIAAHIPAAWAEWVTRPWLRPGQAGVPFSSVWWDGTVIDVIRYFAVVAAGHALDFNFLYQRHRREGLELRAELLEAQLAMLRLQLQPHFLFNALHAISELVYRDPKLADRAITRLADLLRGSLASEVKQECALDAELELLDAYLDIERLRAGDALTITFDVDPATRALAVPNLLLQPLVENALRHGVRGRPSGHVRIGARVTDGRLELLVEDDGAGIHGEITDGLGLRATRARLRGLYGEEQELSMEPRSGGGTVTRVRFPARAYEPRGTAPVASGPAGNGRTPS